MSFIIGEYMSRTYHHRNKRWLVKNSYYKKLLHIWGDDFTSRKGKNRSLNRLARTRQKKIDSRKIQKEMNEI